MLDLVLENRGLIASPAAPAVAAVVDLAAPTRFATTTTTTTTTADQLMQNCMFAATFGHGCQLPKFAHAYFGSEAVVSDLRRIGGGVAFASGEVVLTDYSFVRHPDSQLVMGLVVGPVDSLATAAIAVAAVVTETQTEDGALTAGAEGRGVGRSLIFGHCQQLIEAV